MRILRSSTKATTLQGISIWTRGKRGTSGKPKRSDSISSSSAASSTALVASSRSSTAESKSTGYQPTKLPSINSRPSSGASLLSTSTRSNGPSTSSSSSSKTPNKTGKVQKTGTLEQGDSSQDPAMISKAKMERLFADARDSGKTFYLRPVGKRQPDGTMEFMKCFKDENDKEVEVETVTVKGAFRDA